MSIKKILEFIRRSSLGHTKPTSYLNRTENGCWNLKAKNSSSTVFMWYLKLSSWDIYSLKTLSFQDFLLKLSRALSTVRQKNHVLSGYIWKRGGSLGEPPQKWETWDFRPLGMRMKNRMNGSIEDIFYLFNQMY